MVTCKRKSLDVDLRLIAKKVFVCLLYCFMSKSSAMVMLGRYLLKGVLKNTSLHQGIFLVCLTSPLAYISEAFIAKVIHSKYLFNF